MIEVEENEVTIVGESTRVEGKIVFDQMTRVHGVLVGEIESKPGSTLILAESGLVEGTVSADTLIVDGTIQGNIFVKSRLLVSRTGRILGNIHTPSLTLDFGAFFEGTCQMPESGTPATNKGSAG